MAMKLSEDMPTQHMAIMGLAAAFIVLSLFQSPSSQTASEEQQAQQVQYTESGKPLLYGNPQMSWFQKLFCRGFQRSSSCGYEVLHPITPYLEAEGIEVPGGAPEHREVIRYRGALPKSRGFGGRVTLDDL